MTAAKSTTTKKAAPKQPADRKPPADERDDGVLHVPFRGLTVDVPREALDDFELIADLAAFERQGDLTVLPGVLDRLVGDQYREVLETARDKSTGRISLEAGATLVQELLGALDPNS